MASAGVRMSLSFRREELTRSDPSNEDVVERRRVLVDDPSTNAGGFSVQVFHRALADCGPLVAGAFPSSCTDKDGRAHERLIKPQRQPPEGRLDGLERIAKNDASAIHERDVIRHAFDFVE